MLILNTLENLFLPQKGLEETKKDLLSSTEQNSFQEILHKAVNDAARVETNNLQTYSAISQQITERSQENAQVEPFKLELFQERMQRDNTIESFARNFDSPLETASNKPLQSNEVPREEVVFKTQFSEPKAEISKLDIDKEELEENLETKEVSSGLLLQSVLSFDLKNENGLEKVDLSQENKQVKLERKIDSLENRPEKVEVKNPTLNLEVKPTKELDTKDSKKVESKVVSADLLVSKIKEAKIAETKEVILKETPKEVVRETPKELSKEIKSEDNSKLANVSLKSKEANVVIQKNIPETKPELNPNELAVKLSTSLKEESSKMESVASETRKTKKSSESTSKEQSNLESTKPVQKEYMGMEKDLRGIKEAFVETVGLDRSKWTITRKEKDMESANVERRKDSVTIANDLAVKSNSSQMSSDSEKSFSNSRFDINTFKSFNEALKANNSDKPKETLLDRENFSKSLNDLVSKARINIVENGKNSAQISLYPKELGKMTLNIDVTKERVDGKILVESEFIKSRLMSDVSQLKADLKANGLELQTISIEVRSEGSSGFNFANASGEKEFSDKNSEETNNLSNIIVSEDLPESENTQRKSYNLVDIKV